MTTTTDPRAQIEAAANRLIPEMARHVFDHVYRCEDPTVREAIVSRVPTLATLVQTWVDREIFEWSEGGDFEVVYHLRPDPYVELQRRAGAA